VRVYPQAVHGPMRRIKWAVLCACLLVYYALPWLRWDRGPGAPNQAVLLDVGNWRFYLFSLELWPQDVVYLAGLMIGAAVALFFVTSIAGRIWCGYACPQTVWTDLFMWVERLIQGDRNARMKRDAAPVSFDSAWRKTAKHALWLGIAFWTGGAWIMYFADAPTVTRQFWTGTAAEPVYVFTALFTLTTYALAGWAREQVCTYMCPWPRFQSAMLDEHSLTVTYQAWRGEPRTRGKPAAGGLPGAGGGDCVDCSACVTACPTGIDIRDGVQLECINCGLCMDACDHVMAKLHRNPGLITWDTLARQTARQAGQVPAPIRLLRPRTVVYFAALLLAAVGMTTSFALRQTLSVSVGRDRAPLFVRQPDGAIRNGYTVRVLNQAHGAAEFELAVAGLPGSMLALAESGQPPATAVMLPVEADQVGTFRVLATAPAASVHGSGPIEFVLRNVATGEHARTASSFMGPAQ
jgi:cytochrome c oxidase accessory protein FixG